MTAEDTIKLGLMPPLTGLVGIYGSEIVHAGQIACEEINENGGVLGRPLELVIEDDGSLPESSVAAAEKLVEKHQCSAIIGNLLSNSRIAVAYRIAEPRKIPYLNFSFYEGSILSRYFFHFAALPNQQIDMMIPYMAKHFGSNMFFAGNNYEWPRGSIQAAKQALEKCNGVIVGEEYTNIGVSREEIEQLLDHVEAANPDVFVPYFAGTDQILLLTQFTKRGLKKNIKVVMGHYDEILASKLSPEVREGFYSSNTYFMSLNTTENQNYLQRLAKLSDVDGIWPEGNGFLTNFGEGTYLCVKAFATAVNKAGSLDSETLVDTLKTITILSPQGRVQMNPEHQHATINTYLSRCRADGVFEIVESFGAIKAEIPTRYAHQQISSQATLEEDIRLQSRILEQMNEAVLLVNSAEGSIVYSNSGAEKMFGYDAKGMNNLTIESFDTLATSQTTKEIVTVLNMKGEWQGETQLIKKNGIQIWCSISITTFSHPVHGEVWLWVANDITERVLATANLRESEEKYRLAMDANQGGLWDWNITTGSVYYSPGWKTILGMKTLQNNYDAWESRIFPEDKSRILDSLHSHLNAETLVWQEEYRLRHTSGKYIWVLGRGRVVERASDGTPLRMVGTITDISRQKQIEQELIHHRDHLEEQVAEQVIDLTVAQKNEKSLRKMLQLVLNSIPVRVFWKSKDSVYLGCNKLFAQDAGYKNPKDIIGLTDFDMWWKDQAELYQSDDKLVIQNDQEKLAYEELQHTPDGKKIWLQTSKIPLHDVDDHIIGVLGTYEDITSRKQSEEQLKIAIESAQQANQAKSEFLANMSHELRTPLHGILSFTQFGLKNTHKGDLKKLEKYFHRIDVSGQRLLILLNDLLDLSKLEAGKIALDIHQNNLKTLVECCLMEFEASFTEKQLIVHWGDIDCSTDANFDYARIAQVITNLLSNAFKFSKQGQSIFINIAKYNLSLADNQSIPRILCSIRDEGVGIPENELNHVFDKFIQSSKTKSQAGGTGLGLTICQEIINAHGGKIWAENNKDGGAIFKLVLPV